MGVNDKDYILALTRRIVGLEGEVAVHKRAADSWRMSHEALEKAAQDSYRDGMRHVADYLGSCGGFNHAAELVSALIRHWDRSRHTKNVTQPVGSE